MSEFELLAVSTILWLFRARPRLLRAVAWTAPTCFVLQPLLRDRTLVEATILVSTALLAFDGLFEKGESPRLAFKARLF